MEMSKQQSLYADLLRLSGFNDFDGKIVCDSLFSHRDRWKAFILTSMGSLIVLRDMEDYHNVDTLFITPMPGRETELYALAETWGADEVDWIGGEKACSLLGSYSPEGRANYSQILRVWWG